MEKAALEILCNQVIKIAKDAGSFIKQELISFDKQKIEFKEHNNLVSYVDKTSEQMIVKGLKALLPEAGFIAEEGSASYSNEEYIWIVDPLDGTTNFSHGLPIFSVSIALSKGQDLVLGVVYEVNREECFYAWKEGGAYLNGVKINVSEAPKLADALLATGFPYYEFDKMENYLEILKGFMQKTHGLRRMGSAAVDLCYVACGRFEGFFEYNLKPYDVAGGSIIVKEAGGIVTDFSGKMEKCFSGEEIIASSSLIYNEMQHWIEQNWNK